MIGLIGAMPMEAAPFFEKMEQVSEEVLGPLRFVRGSLAGHEVVLLCCGVGKVNAAVGVQAMLQKYHPECVFHFGVGGSLTGGMNVGDVLIARDCVQYDVDTTALGDPPGFVSTVERIDFPCDERLARLLVRTAETEGLRYRTGRAATGERFLTDGGEKHRIAGNFSALMCDQESGAIAQVCWIHQTPLAVVRAVSDATDGAHGDEYAKFAPDAARTAAELVWKTLAGNPANIFA